MFDIVLPSRLEVLEQIYPLLRVISLVFCFVSVFSPIVVTPIYISVFRSNRERDQATPIYPITYYFYKMVFAFYLSIILMLSFFRSSFDQIFFFISVLFFAVALNLVHVHHILLSLLAIQRFILYFFPNLEKFVSFGFKTTTKIAYFIHFLCFVPFPACSVGGAFNMVLRDGIYDVGASWNQLFVMKAALISTLFENDITEKQSQKDITEEQSDTNRLMVPSITDIFVTPLLVQIPYLFCNRRNVMAMRNRLSLKYLWSRIKIRNNRIGGIGNSDNPVAIAYIQSTHA